MKLLITVSILFLAHTSSYAQADSSIFNNIREAMMQFKPDYSTPPDDKITRKIKELRDLKGGFNINGAIAYKLGEDRKENKMPEKEWKALGEYMSGEGAVKVNNAVTWIYRSHFSYKELQQLVKFYKTAAGRKMNKEFPLLMLKSMLVAQEVKDDFQSK
jgi:hypothetical protein